MRARLGAIPGATKLGPRSECYLFVPLGDRLDRPRLIVSQIMGICVALLVAAIAPTLAILIAASLKAVAKCSSICHWLSPIVRL